MSQIVPYINFPGNTREAMTFYQECLGGELDIRPMPEGMPGPADGVMHSELTGGGLRIMASDMVSPGGLTTGNNISIMIDCSSEEEINRFYSKLAVGGNADHPVQPAFWGGLFGHLTDKFGIAWLLNCSPEGY